MVSKTNLVSSFGLDKDPLFEDIKSEGVTYNTSDLSSVTTPSPELKTKTKSPTPIKKINAGLGVASGAMGIINANFKFEAIDNAATRNIMLANFHANEVESIGKEQALKAETKGFAKGERSILSAVAQGQDVSGGIAQSEQRKHETIGLINAMAIESNAIRQAFGYKQQASLMDLDRDLAEIQRDIDNMGSIASIGVSALGFL